MASFSAPQVFRELHPPGPQSGSPPSLDNNIVRFMNPGFSASYPSRLRAAKVRSDMRPRTSSASRAAPLSCSSSSSAAAVEFEGEEASSASETEGGRAADGRPLKTLSPADFVKEAVRRLSEDELEVAVRKYNLEEELFAEVDYAQVNAFTDRPFAGNPAAVCYLPYAKEDRWLQMIAREFNLSETAFIVKRQRPRSEEDGEEDPAEGEDEEKAEQIEFDLRWFTPKVEVDLCGHATLASAHLLFAAGIVEGNAIIFHTRSGVLRATKVRGYDQEPVPEDANAEQPPAKKRPSGKGVVELDFPISTAEECSAEQAQVLKEGLGVEEVLWTGATSLGDFLVELPSSEHVRAVKPRFHMLGDLPGRGGVIVTARAGGASGQDQGVDFVSRFFCPKAGIDEDPVTGSAHCVLGWYWKSKLGKSRLEAYQASERGGRVSVRVEEEQGRVFLEGGAVLVMAGVILNSLRALDKQPSSEV